MACPFFFPEQRRDDLAWQHPARLPLGAGFGGTCRAGAEPATPDDAALRDACNLGYATSCPRLPADRAADCVRYAIQEDSTTRIVIAWASERAHAPLEHGVAEFDRALGAFHDAHPDPCRSRQLQCYLESHLRRRPPAADERP